MRNSLGSRTIARPMATLCISPPESCAVLRLSRCEIRSFSAADSTLILISRSGVFLRGERRGKARLSYTVMVGYREYCWNTKATSRSAGVRWSTFSPSMEMVPLSCFSRPAPMRRVVVFPAPVGPSRTKNSPCSKEKDTFSSAVTVGKRFVTFASSTRLIWQPPVAPPPRSVG